MKYHPDIELILKYTNGHLDPALAIAIALHYQQCETCRKSIKAFEFDAGASLEELPDSEVTDTGFDQLMAELTGADFDVAVQTSSFSPYEELAVAEVDRPLVEKLDHQQFDQFSWQKVTSKASRAVIDLDDSAYTVELLKLAPRGKIPRHTHQGKEFTLVLQGDFHDQRDTYGEGEFISLDHSHDHQPVAGDDGCICLAITEAPLKFTGSLGPVYNWFTNKK